MLLLVLKFLHILPAVLAGGALMTAAVIASAPDRGNAVATAKALKVAEYSLYVLFLVGLAMGFLSTRANGKMLISAPWLSISMLLWVIIIGVLHGMVRKPVNAAASGDGTTLASKATTGLLILNVLWVLSLALMVFRIPA